MVFNQQKRIIVKRQTDYIKEEDLKKMKNVIYTADKYMLPADELLLINDGTVTKAPNLIERANELQRQKKMEQEKQKLQDASNNLDILLKQLIESGNQKNINSETIKDLETLISQNKKSEMENLNNTTIKKEIKANHESQKQTTIAEQNTGKNNLNDNLEIEKNLINQDKFLSGEDILKDENFENEDLSFRRKESDKELGNQTKAKPISIHKDHRSRLKLQFMEHGIETLSDIQKLEMLLFFSIPLKDTNPLAHELINKFGSLRDVFDADYSSLTNISGIKENTACLIKLVSGLVKHLQMPINGNYISSVSDAKEFCEKLFANVEVEQFYIICLSKSNRVKKVKLLQTGSSDEIMVQIRNVTEFALDSKCNRIIVSHNHPCGYGKMSDEDCTFTYSLICSCILNSIDIVDHIIVGMDKTISLASQNILQKLKEKAVNTIHISHEKLMMLSNSSEEYKLK